MSATAAVVTENLIVLLSDGLTIHTPEDIHSEADFRERDIEIHSRDTPKIHRANPRVGVSWVGTMIPEIQQNIKGCGQTPGEVASWLSSELKEYHTGKDHLLTEYSYNIVIAVTGFDRSGNAWGFDITSKERFTVGGRQLAQNGGIDIMCALPFVKKWDTPFNVLLEKHNKKTKNQVECAKGAFTEMIRQYESKGNIVGGEIFIETITP